MILEPCRNPSQIPRFQCLLLEDGQEPEWCEREGLTSAGCKLQALEINLLICIVNVRRMFYNQLYQSWVEETGIWWEE